MGQQFQKPFPDLLAATRTEVQILETDRFQLCLSPVMSVCFGIFVAYRGASTGFLAARHVLLRIRNFLHLVPKVSNQPRQSVLNCRDLIVAVATGSPTTIEIVSRSHWMSVAKRFGKNLDVIQVLITGENDSSSTTNLL